MKEIVYGYDEFKQKADPAKPVHHDCKGKYVDKFGVRYRMWFRIYGVEKTHGHIIMFEITRDIGTTSNEFMEKYKSIDEGLKAIYHEMVDKYAKPLGSTEGRLTA